MSCVNKIVEWMERKKIEYHEGYMHGCDLGHGIIRKRIMKKNKKTGRRM